MIRAPFSTLAAPSNHTGVQKHQLMRGPADQRIPRLPRPRRGPGAASWCPPPRVRGSGDGLAAPCLSPWTPASAALADRSGAPASPSPLLCVSLTGFWPPPGRGGELTDGSRSCSLVPFQGACLDKSLGEPGFRRLECTYLCGQSHSQTALPPAPEPWPSHSPRPPCLPRPSSTSDPPLPAHTSLFPAASVSSLCLSSPTRSL